MKYTTLLATAALATVALSTASYAATNAAAPAAKDSQPAPVQVVSPTGLPRELANTTVDLVLTIDAQGVPHHVQTARYMDRRFSDPLVAAVSQWRFTPKYVHGHAVASRVVLPLQLVEGA